MKLLVVGDPHLQVSRLDDSRAFLQKIKETSLGHDAVMILGDLFHNFSVIRSEVLSLWNSFLDEQEVQTILLVGNHDYAGQSGGSHSLEFAKNKPNVTVFDSPERWRGHWTGFAFLPFIRDPKVFEAKCQEIEPGKVLFCHQSFTGAQFGSGFLDPNGVDPKCVSHLDLVVSGHIHKRQVIGNIWYPGVPYQHSFGEHDYECRVFSIDCMPGEYNRIVKEYDLGLPKFVVLEATIAQLLEMIPENPDSTTSFKLVSKASPQEILSFWANPRVKEFRKKVRKIVDAIIPDRGEVDVLFKERGSQKEKLEAFIRSRQWRSSIDEICSAAGDLYS